MSAAQYGAGLLADTDKESLNELLADLRLSISSRPRWFSGIAELEQLVEATYITSSQTPSTPGTWRSPRGAYEEDLTHRPGRDPSTAVTARSRARPRPTLTEITSSTSSTGKTSLLYLLTAVSILPKEHDGNESTVVWLNTDATFSSTRLNQICMKQLETSTVTLNPEERQAIAKEALKHVHVFSVQSSQQVLDVLKNLPAYLVQDDTFQGPDSISMPSHQSLHRHLSFLILDSAQAFHWPERLDTELARLESIGTPSASTSTSSHVPKPTESTTTQILNSLKSLALEFDSTILYTTNTSLTTTPAQQPQAQPTTTLPSTVNPQTPSRPNIDFNTSQTGLSQWTTNATLSLSLSRVPIPQFASHMEIEECLADRGKRTKAVRKGRIAVEVNEAWLARVVRDRAVRDKLKGDRGFVMRVDGNGVVVER